MDEKKYELIVCIINAGFSGVVMDAARSAGATGGTLLKARGSAGEEAEKFFHIQIEPEKEIALILVPEDIKDAVMTAVYKEAGLSSAGQGIAFSLPVTRTAGLTKVHEADETGKSLFKPRN